MNKHIEKDSLGDVEVSNDVLYGAQTTRCLNNFSNDCHIMKNSVIDGLLEVKKACASVNGFNEVITKQEAMYVVEACEELVKAEYKKEFPLSVFQTGSGTQTNMNVNEVISNFIMKNHNVFIHPNDIVNRSQSTNDVFPSAMQISLYLNITQNLFPELDNMIMTLKSKSLEYKDVVKVGRTHYQDATPITLGQEFSGYVYTVEQDKKMIQEASEYLKFLAIGGTAVGTCLNATKSFGDEVAKELTKNLNVEFYSSANKFSSLSSKNAIVHTHGAIKTLATDLIKIANDIRFLSSGPDCGIGEIKLAKNEPGSSIMPGKVNPTQAEALIMASCEVIGNDTTISIANSLGNLELNVCMPIIIDAALDSVEVLKSTIVSFTNNCLKTLKPDFEKINSYLHNSLMLVTCLTPVIGYNACAKIANYASDNKVTLKKACLKLGYLTEEEFDKNFDINSMI